MEAPNLWQALSCEDLGSEWRFHVHVRRFLMEEMPGTEEELGKWLEERWVEKGERLEELRWELVKGIEWRDS